jgi:dimethylamine/trimethylamine dehydrogenase
LKGNETMTQPQTASAIYLKTLLQYYEEEASAVTYFNGLAEHIDGGAARGKLRLMAAVERRAADAVLPLLEKYGLVPRDDTVLEALGETHIEQHQNYSWAEFVKYMIARYPAYIDDFEGLESLAPEADLPALKLLTHHEVLTIEFAHKEAAGDPDSTAPLREYLDLPPA